MVNPVDRGDIKALLQAVGTNPAQLVFPVDKWGYTSRVRSNVLKAASSINGNAEKHRLLVNTLLVLIKHLEVRYKRDEAAIQARRERAKEDVSEPASSDTAANPVGGGSQAGESGKEVGANDGKA